MLDDISYTGVYACIYFHVPLGFMFMLAHWHCTGLYSNGLTSVRKYDVKEKARYVGGVKNVL